MTETAEPKQRGRPKLTDLQTIEAKAKSLLEAVEKLPPKDRQIIQRKIHRGTGDTLKELTLNLKAVAKPL